jgi:hypothetical protein
MMLAKSNKSAPGGRRTTSVDAGLTSWHRIPSKLLQSVNASKWTRIWFEAAYSIVGRWHCAPGVLLLEFVACSYAACFRHMLSGLGPACLYPGSDLVVVLILSHVHALARVLQIASMGCFEETTKQAFEALFHAHTAVRGAATHLAPSSVGFQL